MAAAAATCWRQCAGARSGGSGSPFEYTIALTHHAEAVGSAALLLLVSGNVILGRKAFKLSDNRGKNTGDAELVQRLKALAD